MEKQVGDFSYNDISKEEMAAYFERLLNNEKMKEFIASAPSVKKAHLYYRKSARMLLGYVLATGDLSEQTQQKLLMDFIEHKDECFAPMAARAGYRRRNGLEPSNDEKYFSNHILPEILMYQAKKQNIELPLSGENLEKVLSAIYIQGQNTKFLTHSFNGALLDDVRKDGLDISKQKFKDEFDELRSVGIFQPYKTGVLCTCELTETTFGYAVHAPESLFNALNDRNHEQKDDESLRDYLTDGFRLKLQSRTDIDEAKKEKVWQAGQKIIDFYTTGEGNKSAIAFKVREGKPTTEVTAHLLDDFGYNLSTKYSLGKFLNGDEELQAKYNRIKENVTDGRKRFYATLSFLSAFQKKYPDEPLLNNFVSHTCTQIISNTCLPSFGFGGYGDGYSEPNGKIAVKDMAIAVFDNPEEYYAKQRRIKEKTYELMIKGFELEQYRACYADDFKRGLKPTESLEEFKAHHPEIRTLVRNEDGKPVETAAFKLWQKKKGYDNPSSIQTLNLRKSAEEAVKRADRAATQAGLNMTTPQTR